MTTPDNVTQKAKLLREHGLVLQCLHEETAIDGENCIPFAPIIDATDLPLPRVRFICRSLARKGLAEFHRGLWSYDGEPRGSGYCITKAGRAIATGGTP